MAQYRKMGMDPAQLTAMQQMMSSVAAPSGKQDVTAPAASAGSGAPPLTTEKGRLVLRQLPWTPGAETIRPGSESAFEQAMRELGAAMLATPKRYKVEARVEEQGGKSPNRLLARKRAEAVVAALQEQGIASERLTVSNGGADKDPRMVIAERK
jgi:outer membrane protein OmpA-like peptidoglycan-associated protein